MILNTTRKTRIEIDDILKNPFQQAIGLMFSFKPKNLVFEFNEEKNISLHMMFVFFPIDLVFMDSNMNVVELKESIRPFTFYTSKKKAKYLIELKAGSIQKSRTKVNDIFRLENQIH
jgi:uncharacterized protein